MIDDLSSLSPVRGPFLRKRVPHDVPPPSHPLCWRGKAYLETTSKCVVELRERRALDEVALVEVMEEMNAYIDEGLDLPLLVSNVDVIMLLLYHLMCAVFGRIEEGKGET